MIYTARRRDDVDASRVDVSCEVDVGDSEERGALAVADDEQGG